MDYCFGIGCNRAGKSSLICVLNTHPNLYFMNETYIFPRHKKYINDQKNVNIKKIIEEIGYKNKKNIEYDKIKIFGDMGTLYYRYIGDLCDYFPKAKFFHIQRNCWEVLAAFIKDSHYQEYLKIDKQKRYNWVVNLYNQIKIIIDAVDKSVEYVKKNQHEVFVVDFQDMVFNKKETLKKIADFLNVKYDMFDLDVFDSLFYTEGTMYNWKKFQEIIEMKKRGFFQN